MMSNPRETLFNIGDEQWNPKVLPIIKALKWVRNLFLPKASVDVIGAENRHELIKQLTEPKHFNKKLHLNFEKRKPVTTHTSRYSECVWLRSDSFSEHTMKYTLLLASNGKENGPIAYISGDDLHNDYSCLDEWVRDSLLTHTNSFGDFDEHFYENDPDGKQKALATIADIENVIIELDKKLATIIESESDIDDPDKQYFGLQ